MLKNGYIIGKRIREVRRLRSLTQAQLAERAELTAQYISQVELGQKNISLEALINVADSLDISLDSLLFGVQNTSTVQNELKIMELFEDCSLYEIHVLYEIALAAKNALRNNNSIT